MKVLWYHQYIYICQLNQNRHSSYSLKILPRGRGHLRLVLPASCISAACDASLCLARPVLRWFARCVARALPGSDF